MSKLLSIYPDLSVQVPDPVAVYVPRIFLTLLVCPLYLVGSRVIDNEVLPAPTIDKESYGAQQKCDGYDYGTQVVKELLKHDRS
jgi:hypothetical protein